MIQEAIYPHWLDYLEHFLEVDPDAPNEELFRRFPELQRDEKVLDAAYAHILAVKIDGITQATLRTKFPEIYRPKKKNWFRKLMDRWRKKI